MTMFYIIHKRLNRKRGSQSSQVDDLLETFKSRFLEYLSLLDSIYYSYCR